LRIKDSQGTQQFRLAERPVLKLIIDSFLRVLSGDRDALTRSYHIQFTGNADGLWNMTLKPKHKELSRLLRTVRLKGKRVAIQELIIVETNDDRTITTFSEINSARRFNAVERKQLLGVPAR
jgi:hypothetical protein